MNRTIHLRHLANSSLTGQSRDFTQARIRFGRKPDNDVVFDPDKDRLVSGYHCEIVAEHDSLFVVDPGSTNGTYVNGRRVQGSMPVTDRDQITLGDGGPAFAVTMAGVESPRTIMGTTAPDLGLPPAARAGLMSTPINPGGAPSPVGVGVPPVQMPPVHMQAGGTAVAAPPQQAYSLEAPAPVFPPGAPPMVDRLPSRASQGVKTHIGMNTLMSELDKASRRERKRVLSLMAPAVGVLLLGIGLAWYFTRSKVQAPVVINQTSTTTIAASQPVEWAQVLGPRKQSVYLMVVKNPDKADDAQGTAWSVAPGVLATNAHVAALFETLGPKDTLYARSNTVPPHDLRITGIKMHPGYTTFGRLRKAYFPIDVDKKAPMIYPSTHDCALMTVAEEDKAKQTKPLELANADALSHVRETSEVAYIGYPMDGSNQGGVNVQSPEPHQFVGNVSRKTDIFLSAANPARTNFIQYTLIVQGGSSGSPVFNKEGKVIGLVAGNDVLGRGQTGARIMISGKSFGPTVDLVQQLLDNTADTKLADSAADWRKYFRAIHDKVLAAKLYEPFPGTRAQLSFKVMADTRQARGQTWNVDGIQRKVLQTVASADLKAAGGSKEFATESLPDNGYYCIVVTSDNADVTPKIVLPEVDEALAKNLHPAVLQSTREQLGDGTPHVATYPLKRAKDDQIKYVLSGVPTDPAGNAEAKFTVTLFRAVVRE